MFSITFQFGPQQAPWTLLYKTEDAMKSAVTIFDAGHPSELVTVNDDYGQKLRVRKDAVQAMLLEDMLESQQAHIDRSIHAAVTQAKTMQRASGDATIKAAQLASQRAQQPQVFSPMGNGRGY